MFASIFPFERIRLAKCEKKKYYENSSDVPSEAKLSTIELLPTPWEPRRGKLRGYLVVHPAGRLFSTHLFVVYMQNNFSYFYLRSGSRKVGVAMCVAGESLPQFSRNCFSEPALGPPTERSWRGGKIGKFSRLKNNLISYFHMSAVNTPNRGKNWCEGKNLFFLRSESANFSWIFSQSNANF